MSDKRIRAGDLVAVVTPTPCCGNIAGVGWVMIVSAIRQSASFGCTHCGADKSDGRLIAGGVGPKGYGYVEVSRLRKISPPPISESTERTKELTT